MRREAPCCIPKWSWEGFEEISLGQMAYLDSKGEGDQSMPANRRSGAGVWDDAPGDPRDMAKAKLPEPQSSADAALHPPERRLKPVPVLHGDVGWTRALFEAGAMPSEGIEEDEWGAYVTLRRTARTNAGSPTGRESYGDGVPVVVAGVTTCQGGRESRPQGEEAQVTGHPMTGRYAKCRRPKRS